MLVIYTTPLLTQCLLYHTFFRASGSVVHIDGRAMNFMHLKESQLQNSKELYYPKK